VSIFLDIPDETWEAIREQTSTIQISEALAGIPIENPNNAVEFVGPHTE
jgi:hypothetical protein